MSDFPPADQALVDSVVQIARAGGQETLKWFRHSALEVESKSDGTPVTQADKAAEHVILEMIHELSPNSSIVGEEHGSVAGNSGMTWHVDPIDGTKGFARGVPLYATLVSVRDTYGPAAGAVYIPATDEIVSAGRGLGCYDNDGRVWVSSTPGLEGAFVTTSSVSRWGNDVFARVCRGGAHVKGWGDGYGFLMVATGRIDAMVDLHGGSPWDFAPMPVILGEAGGKFTDVDGEINSEGPSGIGSNGLLHRELLRAIVG